MWFSSFNVAVFFLLLLISIVNVSIEKNLDVSFRWIDETPHFQIRVHLHFSFNISFNFFRRKGKMTKLFSNSEGSKS